MKNKDFDNYKLNEEGALEGFNAVVWSRKVKRETGKQWTDKDGGAVRHW